jgi:integrase
MGPMIVKARAELAGAGITDQPAVVLADAGYWHGEQIDRLMGEGLQVLVPPDADKRRGTRPGWDGGRYAFMRNVLDTPAAGELYAQHLGACAGLRRDEIRGMQGRHFRRDGFVWVSSDVAKGGRERWVPVIADLQAVWDEIAANVADEHFVVPAQRWRDPPRNTRRTTLHTRAASPQYVCRVVAEVARRAGIQAHIHPHLLRHAFGDHVARYAGLHAAQALLGHATVDTTASTYVGKPTLDELASSVTDMTFHRHLSGMVDGPGGDEAAQSQGGAT